MSVCEIFSRALPEFLAIGMTVEQFYDERCDLVNAFKKAYRIRRQRDNFDAYLQGAYFYEALTRCRNMFNPFSGGGKIDPWLDEPYDIGLTGDRKANIGGGTDGDGANEAAVTFFQSFMARHNAFLDQEAHKAMGEKDTRLESNDN